MTSFCAPHVNLVPRLIRNKWEARLGAGHRFFGGYIVTRSDSEGSGGANELGLVLILEMPTLPSCPADCR
jgi:hypothetical protein